MKLSSYLSPSRHGVYYFRWPLPQSEGNKRTTLRLSLRTRCPSEAGDIARHLATCGRLVRDNKSLARLRQDEIREHVRRYFVKVLDGYTERLNSKGWSERDIAFLKEELAVHKDGIANFDDLSDQYLDGTTVDGFRQYSEIDEADWDENEADLRRELRKGRRDQIKALLKVDINISK